MPNNRTPSLLEVLRAAVKAGQRNIHTAIPARVESYDANTQTVSVKPLIMDAQLTADGEEILQKLPVITRVPVMFPRTGSFFLSLPIVAGDTVLLVFCEKSIEKWLLSAGEETDPTDLRTHDISDAVAIPGLFPFGDALDDAHASNLVLGKDGGVQIHVTPTQVHLGQENPTEFVALATKVLTELQKLETFFNAHVHSGVTTGGGSSGPPAAPVTPIIAAVAATKVKAV